MPTPKKGESRKEYMARCIPMVMKEGDGLTKEQAAGKCGGMYDQHKKQARNEQMKLQTITFNLDTKTYRKATLNGREHIVVPTVMMVEGVHHGSQGKLLYEADELSKWCPAWNTKPITLNHPQKNGQYVSAADAEVLDSVGLGVVMNTRWDNKQRCEAWLDVEKLKTKAEKVLNAIHQKRVLEISTGVYVDREGEPGEWNGQDYDGIARNHRPDHLAILEGSVGACSVAKGAGLFQLNEANLGYILDRESSRKKGLLQTLAEHGRLKEFVTSELSHSAVSSLIYGELREQNGDDWNGWIEDVFDSFFVYWDDGELKKRKYLTDDTGVELSSDDPVSVQRVVSYLPVGNETGEGEEDMAKKELVDALISNKATKFEETDREWLSKLTDDQVKKLEPTANETQPKPGEKGNEKTLGALAPKEEIEAAVEKGKQNPGESNPAPAANKTQQDEINEYIAKAPGPIRNMLANGVAVYNQEREKHINTILTNKNNRMKREDLEQMDLNVLFQMAQFAQQEAARTQQAEAPPAPNYFGLGMQTQNVSHENHEEEPLELPTLNFEKKAG